MKGEKVIVRTFGGRPRTLLVLGEIGEKIILAVSEERYWLIEAGQERESSNEWPASDVFRFDPDVVDSLMQEWETNPEIWGQLTLYRLPGALER